MAAAPEHDENGQPVTDQAIAVTDGPKGVTTFTREQVEAARAYADASRAASTRAKYLQHWAAFGLWCQQAGHRALPADPVVVAVHLPGPAAAGTAPGTLALRMAAIGYAHRQAGEVPPHKLRGGTVILDILAGARRASKQARRGSAFTIGTAAQAPHPTPRHFIAPGRRPPGTPPASAREGRAAGDGQVAVQREAQRIGVHLHRGREAAVQLHQVQLRHVQPRHVQPGGGEGRAASDPCAGAVMQIDAG